MSDAIGLLLLAICLSVAGIFLYKSGAYVRSIQLRAVKHPLEIRRYGRDIVLGIVTGGSLIIIERIVDLIIAGASQQNVFNQSLLDILRSLLSDLVMLLLLASLMLWGILYLINKGLPIVEG